ncbi:MULTISPECIES: YccF domain-containing protein [unclassified Streptomyces]|uniref:YccF domain-containing protein n=1 Tax=Streptomyces evansiae TaxID=3075535 RepID=A0ABD5E2V0_9ACTN|nr:MULTISPECIES: YccF domain-containing protein [unclassified Streptomyces]MYQ61048.1 YccF domain-containing protein [Streptomyces sp. SID4926]EGJ75350.1 putative integral membrane protein [Streptomyces sp. Tu6071]MDT0407549.1 YccF domain-containing protein [Streptomyces sp. DSM 41979]MDT0415316.1 YccF domain-containing protein [Streptomyces sp. DSM 41982]MDT0421435.1 YccF domain-containing protein [Streptomyces sp. DSM 41859]
MKLLNLVLNLLWLIFCGIWMALGYLLAGLICCVFIITIPFGIASFRIAGYVLWPFGRTTVERPDAGAPSFVGNVIWVVFAGWWLALGHLLTSIPLFVSIIGIPFGWANLKLIPISLMPLGREVVPSDQPFAARPGEARSW